MFVLYIKIDVLLHLNLNVASLVDDCIYPDPKGSFMLKPDCLNSSDKARVEIDATSLLDDGRLITFKLAPSNTSLQLFHNTVEYFKRLSVNAARYLEKEERERIKEMIEDIESDFNGDIDENQLRPMEEVVQLLMDLPQRVNRLARKVEATAKEAFMRKLEQCIGSQNSKNMPRLIVNYYYISSPKVEAIFAGSVGTKIKPTISKSANEFAKILMRNGNSDCLNNISEQFEEYLNPWAVNQL